LGRHARSPETEFLKNAVVDIGFDVLKPVKYTKVNSGGIDN
jgi:hypothetical protein